MVIKIGDEAAVPHHLPSLTAAAYAFMHSEPPLSQVSPIQPHGPAGIIIVPISVQIVKLSIRPIQLIQLLICFWTWTAIFV